MVRNFRSWNTAPPLPSLPCRKRTGPGEVALISRAIRPIKGIATGIRTNTPIKSMARFHREKHQGLNATRAEQRGAAGARASSVSLTTRSRRRVQRNLFPVQESLDVVNHVADFFLGHVRKDGQGETARISVLGI